MPGTWRWVAGLGGPNAAGMGRSGQGESGLTVRWSSICWLWFTAPVRGSAA